MSPEHVLALPAAPPRRQYRPAPLAVRAIADPPSAPGRGAGGPPHPGHPAGQLLRGRRRHRPEQRHRHGVLARRQAVRRRAGRHDGGLAERHPAAGQLLPEHARLSHRQPVSERGLLGVAFDPNYATNRFVYVYYTDHRRRPPQPRQPLHRQRRRRPGPGRQRAGHPRARPALAPRNHNGGAIHFGPDGKLYVAVGDNATGANAQSLANRHGKMLRINADGTIPADNPFFITATGANRAIWALGLRNPFTFTFQPGTGRMHINDVGQNTWEEINVGAAGANYGWPTTEGDFNQAQLPELHPAVLRLLARRRHVPGLRHHRRRVLQPGQPRHRPLPRRRTTATTSSPTSSTTGSTSSTRAPATVTRFATERPGRGGPARRRRRQPLLPGPRRRQRLPRHLHRQPGPGITQQPQSQTGRPGRLGDVHRRRHRQHAAHLPVAAGRGRHLDLGQHRRRHRVRATR